MENNVLRKMQLIDEGSWALMIEESNVKAIQRFHGNMAGLNIDYYLSVGEKRYYKDYLSVENIKDCQKKMIEFLENDFQYNQCIDAIRAILDRMACIEESYAHNSVLANFDNYCETLCQYIAYYNSVIADAFYENVYAMVDKLIPAELKFANKVLKDALFATDNLNLLSHMQTVDLVRIIDKYQSGENVDQEIKNYIEKYRSTTSSSGSPNGVSAEEIKNIVERTEYADLQTQKAFLENLHYRYQHAREWSKETAKILRFDEKIQTLIHRTAELSYMKILMREQFQEFKIKTRQSFLTSLINEIGKQRFDYMLISEIRNYIENKTCVSEEVLRERKESFVFELKNNFIQLSHGIPDNVNLNETLEGDFLNGDVLIGSGKQRYTVKKIKQDEEGLIEFNTYLANEKCKSDVAIVTNVLRPFLVPQLKEFGVLLTQYGGYTSHASVLCRELGINSIISVDGLMNSLETGDTIEINFDNGKIHVVSDISNDESMAQQLVIPLQSEVVLSKLYVGSKAANLIKLNKIANVPKGFVLTSYALNNLNKEYVKNEILNAISDLKCPLLVIRSSHESEDTNNSSYAGLYESFVNIESSDYEKIFSCISQVFNSGNADSLDNYVEHRPGDMHVIIQEMIKADLSGVLLTSIAKDGYEYMLNEYTVGDLCYLMQGEVTPAISYLKKIDIINNCNLVPCYPAVISMDSWEDFYKLYLTAVRLEKVFGHRLEIEWGIKDKEVYIFQARFY